MKLRYELIHIAQVEPLICIINAGLFQSRVFLFSVVLVKEFAFSGMGTIDLCSAAHFFRMILIDQGTPPAC